jgi:hypothetical protein
VWGSEHCIDDTWVFSLWQNRLVVDSIKVLIDSAVALTLADVKDRAFVRRRYRGAFSVRYYYKPNHR